MSDKDTTSNPLHVIHHQSAPLSQARNTSGLAVTSMILGIISLVGGVMLIIPPILAVVFGHVSVNACKKNPLLDGKGMGIAGLVMGWISLAGWIVFFLFLGGIAAIVSGDAAARH